MRILNQLSLFLHRLSQLKTNLDSELSEIRLQIPVEY